MCCKTACLCVHCLLTCAAVLLIVHVCFLALQFQLSGAFSSPAVCGADATVLGVCVRTTA
jgi:hypothetical protein